VTERGGARVTSRPARGHRVWEPAAGAPESQPESGVALERRPGDGGKGRRGRGRPERGSPEERRIPGGGRVGRKGGEAGRLAPRG